MPLLLRRATAVVVVAGVVVSLSGCGGDEPAVAQPSPTSGAATSAAASPAAVSPYLPPSSAPTPPPTSAPDAKDAAKFVFTWFETLNYGFAHNDATPLRNSTGLGCFTCANWIIEVQRMHDSGVQRSAGAVHVSRLQYLGRADDDFTFRALVQQDAGTITAKDGTRTPIAGGSAEIVDLKVGISRSTLTDSVFWTMKSVAPPAA